ncbi:MAG: trimethylamine methyltransferase family protein [Dehalococcoidia bacterium]|nr:trimethylamine methyltransferase family protein [Dehalococcoidia bacterium]
MGTSLPHYRPLAAEDIGVIDQAARRILERTGIRISDSHYLRLLEKAGARVDYESERALLDGEWLDSVLSHAPSRLILYSRDGKNNLQLGEGKVYFTNGGRVFRVLDAMTGSYRLTVLEDVADTAALVQHLDNIRFYIIACQVHDLEPAHYHLNDFFHSFNHTTKHVMGGCDDLEGARHMWRLASLVAGSEDRLREKPFISVITNPVSPLTIDSNTLNILEFCAAHGIPATCAPAPISGATAPATLAGTLAQMHAESLAGVAVSQVFAPGAAVLYGAVPMTMDLRGTDLALGSVETAMMNAAAVQLARRYSLPIYGSGGLTDAKRLDIQAGIETAFSSLAVAMAGADCIHLAAGILDSGNSISLEQYVIDDEIIGMVQRLLAGIRVTEDTLGVDVIDQVGPGGNFIMEDHTVNHMMDEFFYPNLSIRYNLDIWEERGCPDMLSRAGEAVREILSDPEGRGKGLLDPDLVSEIKKTFPGIRNIQ